MPLNNAIEGTSIEDKNDSELSNIRLSEKVENMIEDLNKLHGQSKVKILELIESMKQDGLKDREIKKVLFNKVKFFSRATLYNALPQELKREYTKPLPKTINIGTAKVIDVEPTKEQSDHDWHYEQGEKEEERMEKIEESKREADLAEAEYRKEKEKINFPEPDQQDNIRTCTWKVNIENLHLAMDSVAREFPKLKNRGWKLVKITVEAL